MPAGESPSPGAEPLHQVLVIFFPEGKIGGVLFVVVLHDFADGDLEFFAVAIAAEFAVVGE